MTQRNGAKPFSKTREETRKNVRTEEKADKVSMQQVGEAWQESKLGVRRVHKRERRSRSDWGVSEWMGDVGAITFSSTALFAWRACVWLIRGDWGFCLKHRDRRGGEWSGCRILS